MRWASPPERVCALRSSERYSIPTSSMKERRASISFVTTLEIFFSRSVSFFPPEADPPTRRAEKNSSESLIESFVSSTIFLPPISTLNASFLRRVPRHDSHGSLPKRYLVPRPLHSGQAPYGELKENRRGSISGKEKPSLGDAHLADIRNSASLKRATKSPSDSLIAFSIASASRSLAFFSSVL